MAFPKKPAPKVEAADVEAPALITPPKLEEGPAYLALQTRLTEMAAKQAEQDKVLAGERNAREKAEDAAREQERFQTVFKSLTDIDGKVRTDPDGGQMATQWILSQYKVSRSKQTGGYFVEVKDAETGETKTEPLKGWTEKWLLTKEGQRFRPALPSGAGPSAGMFGNQSQDRPDMPLSDAERMGRARQKDRLRTQQGLN